jgi:hypothetical protein
VSELPRLRSPTNVTFDTDRGADTDHRRAAPSCRASRERRRARDHFTNETLPTFVGLPVEPAKGRLAIGLGSTPDYRDDAKDNDHGHGDE